MSTIIEYRIKHGLTLKELAKKLGVGTSTVYRWQVEPKSIPLYKVARIAKTLSV